MTDRVDTPGGRRRQLAGRRLLMSGTVLVSAFALYGRRAYAACVVTTPPNVFECSNAETAQQTIAIDDATVTTNPGFSVNTADPFAVTITGNGTISYIDQNGSSLEAADTALVLEAPTPAGGSIVVDTNGDLTGGNVGLSVVNAAYLGAGTVTITTRGDVTGTADAGIYAFNSALGGMEITTAAGTTVTGGSRGIYADNSGSGSLTITTNGDVEGIARAGIYALNGNSATDLTVATGPGSAVSGDYFGALAINGGTGMLTLTANGDVEGTQFNGIAARNYGTNLTLTTGAGTSVTGGYTAIAAYNLGSGALTMTVNGDVDGDQDFGIVAMNYGTDLTLTTGVGSTVTGGRTGIYAINLGTGPLAITVNGDVTGESSDGIYASQCSCQPIVITVGPQGSVTSNGSTLDHVGIEIAGGPASVIVAGTVNGNAGGAIRFDPFDPTLANRLELRPGFTINGTVFAGTGADDTLAFGGTGAGVFDLGDIDTGADTEQYRGFEMFAVEGGAWSFTGATGATFDVNTGGVLGGNGAFGGLNINAGGTIAPGNSIGTITVAGNVVFNPGSTYEVEVDAAGASDRIDASGAVTINGGTLAVLLLDPAASYQTARTYRIIDAAGGVQRNADFDLPQPYLFLDLGLDYGAGYVDLTLARRAGGFTSVARTYNQFQAATGLGGLAQTGDALAVFNQLLSMTDADAARRALDLASGEIHASGQHVVDHTLGGFLNALGGQASAGIGAGGTGSAGVAAYALSPRSVGSAAIDELTTSANADRRVRQAWLAPLGGGGSIAGDGNAARLDWWSAGVAGGYSHAFDGERGIAGFGMGYVRSHGEIDARLSSMDVDGFFAGLHAGWAQGSWAFSGSLAYGASRIATERRIIIGGIDRTAEATYWSHGVGASGEVAYGFDLGAGATLSPLATLDAGWSSHGGFAETGAGALDLAGATRNRVRLDTGLGVALRKDFVTESGKVTLEGRAVWEHAFANVTPSRSLAFAGSPVGFEVRGPRAGRDRLRLGAGLAFEVDDGLTLRARYDGVFSGSQQSHDASGGISVKF
ncbi:MAG: autotransporter domain-containing protein [Rhizobiaceae bacterium]